MPKLWNATIESHRREVRETILESTWELVTERGLLSVTMSQVAEAVGIGRATLYKYFPDVEAILAACHERHVTGHLERLRALRVGSADPGKRLAAVLRAYAHICHHRERQATPELAALLHRGEHVDHAQQQLLDLFRDLVAEAVEAGAVRDDVPAAELARYCLHALGAAGSLPSEAAVGRLVGLTLAALQPQG